MSFQAVSRIVRACGVKSTRQFLGRKLPCRVGERNLYMKQEKRPATREEMGILVLGLGVLSSASVWVRKKAVPILVFVHVFMDGFLEFEK